MKTLIINGSPRKNGDTMALISEMKKHLQGEMIIINTYYDDISPCTDCRYCWTQKGCSIDDGMQDVYKLLNEVDNVILASPLYFSELTGKLLSFSSRFQYFYASKYKRKDSNFRLKKKNAVLIITGGGDGGPDPAIGRANILFRQINAELVETVLSLKTDEISAIDDVEAMNKAKKCAIKLNELCL